MSTTVKVFRYMLHLVTSISCQGLPSRIIKNFVLLSGNVLCGEILIEFQVVVQCFCNFLLQGGILWAI